MNTVEKYKTGQNLPLEVKATFSMLSSKADPKALQNEVLTGIAMAFAMTGQKSNFSQEEFKNELAFLVKNTSDQILIEVPNIRLEEIPLAIKKGILGELGEWFGLNVVTFVKFIKVYYESEKRLKIMIDNRIPEPEKLPPSPEELRIAENEIIVNAFKKFSETGSYEDHGNHIYNKLDARGLIPYTGDRKKKFMEEAKSNLLARNNTKTALSLEEKRTFERVVSAIMNNTPDSRKDIVREAKKIALKVLFNELIEMETDIVEFIEGTGNEA